MLKKVKWKLKFNLIFQLTDRFGKVCEEINTKTAQVKFSHSCIWFYVPFLKEIFKSPQFRTVQTCQKCQKQSLESGVMEQR